MTKLFDFRKEYTLDNLAENEVTENPIRQFNQWMHQAIAAGFPEPNAMTLATATLDGKPSVRVVLLKEVNDDGFVFFTNYLSRKGRELLANPFAAVVFDWHEMERQVRIEGRVEKLSAEDSDTYFNARPETSKIGAWASPQSKIINSRQELDEMWLQTEQKLLGKPVHRPLHWGGFLVRPTVVEFWQGRPNRLHDRLAYYKTEEGWTLHRLAP
ncbi:MAG: pyridoxamine 5'-phosphate oxidase [Bacteroidia bacterium]|nr:pyridoxamine 5'-phosphate oxidase [Bacteroidia bacterium]